MGMIGFWVDRHRFGKGWFFFSDMYIEQHPSGELSFVTIGST